MISIHCFLWIPHTLLGKKHHASKLKLSAFLLEGQNSNFLFGGETKLHLLLEATSCLYVLFDQHHLDQTVTPVHSLVYFLNSAQIR